MNIVTFRKEVSPEMREKYGFKPWQAHIRGPWYDDSSPEGQGDTEAEAVEEALGKLKRMHDEVGAFLREKGKLP